MWIVGHAQTSSPAATYDPLLSTVRGNDVDHDHRIEMIDGVNGIDASWLTDALAGTGWGVVAALDVSPVGTGQVADTVRLDITWADEGSPDRPASLVAKVAAADPTSRQAAAFTRTYEVEAAFYADLADELPVRTPACYHVDHDAAGNRYVVVLEDLAPARQGDQLAGCTLEDARTCLVELVQLHAPRWDDPTLEDLAWLHRYSDEAVAAMAGIITALAPGFLERYRNTLDPDVAALCGELVPRLAAVFADRPRPWTVAHGDFRLDNLLFGDGRVAVVDWQTVAHGPGIADLSYFLGAGFTIEDRRRHEHLLVEEYTLAMAAAGVVGLEVDAAWLAYRRFAFGGLIMAIVASMLVGQTERGDAMFMTMANRHGRHALDLDSLSLVPS